MDDYRQWYDDDGITFHSEHKVQFSQADSGKRLSFFELLKVSSDMAVEDYAQQGLDRDTLTAHGYACLVSRVAFRFHRIPVTVLTRCWQSLRLQAHKPALMR